MRRLSLTIGKKLKGDSDGDSTTSIIILADGTEKEVKMTRQEQVEHHRKMCTGLATCKRDLSGMRTILQEMCDVYYASESDCPIFRYGDMHTMVEEALQAYQRLMSIENEVEENERMKLMGTMQRLAYTSRRLSMAEHAIAEQEQMYSKMSSAQLAKELNAVEREYQLQSLTVSRERAKVEELAKQFNHLKRTCFIKKYFRLKEIIEEATIDCLRDE